MRALRLGSIEELHNTPAYKATHGHQQWKAREARESNMQRMVDEFLAPLPKAKRHPKAAPPATVMVDLCRAAGLPVPVTEHQFHPGRRWRFDYAWPEHKLALEIEGGIWQRGGGGHSHPMHIERDIEKYSEAAILGWRILRVVPEEIVTIGLDRVMRAFAVMGAKP